MCDINKRIHEESANRKVAMPTLVCRKNVGREKLTSEMTKIVYS